MGFCVWAFSGGMCVSAMFRAFFNDLFLFFYDFLVKNSLYTEGAYFSIPATKLFKFIPFLMFLLDFYCLKAYARTFINLKNLILLLIFGFFRLFIFYFLIIARNGCVGDVQGRWALCVGFCPCMCANAVLNKACGNSRAKT